MSDLARTLRPVWPMLTFVVSGALLAGAHAFEKLGGLQPCPLCLDQREWHWGVLGASFAGFLLVRFMPKSARLVALALGLVLLGAAGMAFFHVAVEQHWIIWHCEVDVNDLQLGPMDESGTFEVPQCDQIAWQMLGLSMAGWNGVISGAFALASFFVALMPEKKA